VCVGSVLLCFFFQAEDGIRDRNVTGVQTCALPISYEVVPKAEVDELLLEEVPTVDFSDIGGLVPQIEQIRDAIELPFVHHDLYREFHLAPPKGVLLYGPPGNGKTLIAK